MSKSKMTDEMWAAVYRDECEVQAIEAAIEAEHRARAEQAIAEYKADRAREERAEAWLADVGNADIVKHVRELVREAGAGVLDLVELKAERAQRPKTEAKILAALKKIPSVRLQLTERQ